MQVPLDGDASLLTEDYLYNVFLFPVNKAEALAYLDHGGPLPTRYAKVIAVRGAHSPPDVMEYKVCTPSLLYVPLLELLGLHIDCLQCSCPCWERHQVVLQDEVDRVTSVNDMHMLLSCMAIGYYSWSTVIAVEVTHAFVDVHCRQHIHLRAPVP